LTSESGNCLGNVKKGEIDVFAEIIWSDFTTWAPILLATCNEALFGVVGNICGQNGKQAADHAICTNHLHSFMACLHQWFDDPVHTIVIQLAPGIPTAFLGFKM
jgi:hypothetical protein